jgi:hypothetical protein
VTTPPARDNRTKANRNEILKSAIMIKLQEAITRVDKDTKIFHKPNDFAAHVGGSDVNLPKSIRL